MAPEKFEGKKEQRGRGRGEVRFGVKGVVGSEAGVICVVGKFAEVKRKGKKKKKIGELRKENEQKEEKWERVRLNGGRESGRKIKI